MPKPLWQRALSPLVKFNDPPPTEDVPSAAPASQTPPLAAAPFFPKAASPVPSATSGVASAETDILTTAFPDLYSRNGVVGNPQIDPILTAYSQMAGPLKGEGLVTAMKAMMQGMGVPEAVVIETLTKRLAVLTQTLTEENAKAADRKTGRDQALSDLKEKVLAQIAKLEAQIAELKQLHSDKDREVADANAGDFGAMKAFEVKITAEQQRLTALKTFLEGGVKS